MLALVLIAQGESRALAREVITVKKCEPTTDRIFFDRRTPPVGMPKLKRNEAALCQYHFQCEVQLTYETTDQSRDESSGQTTATARITSVNVTLTLHNTIYLPRGAPSKLRAHEEGHRIIHERAYESAEAAARAAARDIMTRNWTARGSDADAAGRAATDLAVNALCDAYLAETAGVASRVGDIYDELTQHGRNRKLKESDAIEQAYDRYRAEKRASGTADQRE